MSKMSDLAIEQENCWREQDQENWWREQDQDDSWVQKQQEEEQQQLDDKAMNIHVEKKEKNDAAKSLRK